MPQTTQTKQKQLLTIVYQDVKSAHSTHLSRHSSVVSSNQQAVHGEPLESSIGAYCFLNNCLAVRAFGQVTSNSITLCAQLLDLLDHRPKPRFRPRHYAYFRWCLVDARILRGEGQRNGLADARRAACGQRTKRAANLQDDSENTVDVQQSSQKIQRQSIGGMHMYHHTCH